MALRNILDETHPKERMISVALLRLMETVRNRITASVDRRFFFTPEELADYSEEIASNMKPLPETAGLDLVGRVGVCSKGRLGHIEGQKELEWGLSWVGFGFDGEEWASRDPRILSESEQAALALAVEGSSVFVV